MPLGRGEREAVCQAAQAAHDGRPIKWDIRGSSGSAVLYWIDGTHEHKVCSSADMQYFAALCQEAARRFDSEWERLKNGNGNGSN